MKWFRDEFQKIYFKKVGPITLMMFAILIVAGLLTESIILISAIGFVMLFVINTINVQMSIKYKLDERRAKLQLAAISDAFIFLSFGALCSIPIVDEYGIDSMSYLWIVGGLVMGSSITWIISYLIRKRLR